MTQLYEIKVNLSLNQKRNLVSAYQKRETVVLWLTKDSLSQNVVKRLQKSKKMNKGMDIKLSKTNIRKQGGSGIFSALMPIVRSVLPTIGKKLRLQWNPALRPPR